MKSDRRPPRRLASDKEIDRAFEHFEKRGLKAVRVRLGADGSIELDSAPTKGLGEGEGAANDADSFEDWERENLPARR